MGLSCADLLIKKTQPLLHVTYKVSLFHHRLSKCNQICSNELWQDVSAAPGYCCAAVSFFFCRLVLVCLYVLKELQQFTQGCVAIVLQREWRCLVYKSYKCMFLKLPPKTFSTKHVHYVLVDWLLTAINHLLFKISVPRSTAWILGATLFFVLFCWELDPDDWTFLSVHSEWSWSYWPASTCARSALCV